MMRNLFLLALLVAAASAFVAPANMAVASTRSAQTAPNMMIDGSILESAANNANLIATSSGDNGGAFFPVVGIISLAGLILFLAPPLADAE
ncbi:hypothetical protein ACHAXT_003904 [Thalassiosira profunda]